jgi:outer membrane protein G
MKKLLFIGLLSLGFSVNAQKAYSGKDDVKGSVGANFQDGGNSIVVTADKGFGENISFGIQGAYLLGYKGDIAPPTGDRFDFKLRFNANIGNVLGLPENMDVYPGLNLGLRNFGGHLGFRYFFTDGFGLYSEVAFPFAKYDKDKILNNQTTLHIGASFNLN